MRFVQVVGVISGLVASSASFAAAPFRHVGTPSRQVLGGLDCAGGEVHDDGTAEGGLTWSGGVVGTYVEKLTPSLPPFRYDSVCLCWFQQNQSGDQSIDFDLVFYDDNGPGGQPGAFLGSLPATATAVPDQLPGAFYRYDVSSLGLEVQSGSMYVGAQWDSGTEVDFLLCTDETPATPLNGPHGSFDSGANWFSIAEVFPVRSFLIRAEGVGLPAPRPPEVPALSAAGVLILVSAIGLIGVRWLRRR